jgi:hypothetical protein
MRNANLEDERKLHDRGEFDTNVMFQWGYEGERYHIKNVGYPLGEELRRENGVIAENAVTGELSRFARTNLHAINMETPEQSKKKPRIKPHVKGTRPETLVPYDSKLMNKPRWVRLRDGARAYFYCGMDSVMNGYLRVFEGASSYLVHCDSIVGVYLPYEEWNSVESTPSDGWISGNDVPKDGNSYFVREYETSNVYVVMWSIHNKAYFTNGVIYSGLFWVSSYKPVEHEGLYRNAR